MGLVAVYGGPTLDKYYCVVTMTCALPARNPSFVMIGCQKTVLLPNIQYYCSNVQPSRCRCRCRRLCCRRCRPHAVAVTIALPVTVAAAFTDAIAVAVAITVAIAVTNASSSHCVHLPSSAGPLVASTSCQPPVVSWRPRPSHTG
jgi:hypothetical protein